MGSLVRFFVPPKPKSSPVVPLLLAKQQGQEDAEKKRLQKQQNARLRARTGRNAGFRSLLSGLETGVPRGRTELG